MSWRQKMIDEHFGGDVARYEADEYAHAVTEGRLYAIDWKDLEIAATILPELETSAQDLIERRLGYLPHDSVIVAYEPFLRVLIKNHRQGSLSDEDFSAQAEEHLKLIRNEDLKLNADQTYEPRIYKNYETYLSHYRQKVKGRLTGFLGYEPNLEHSIIAEMWLCEIIAKDTFQLPRYVTAIDLKALTLIKYREVLLEQGQDAADASPLLGIEPAIK